MALVCTSSVEAGTSETDLMRWQSKRHRQYCALALISVMIFEGMWNTLLMFISTLEAGIRKSLLFFVMLRWEVCVAPSTFALALIT